jgi:hypothetical protein
MPRPKGSTGIAKKNKQLKTSESNENIQFSLQDGQQPQPEVKKRGRKPKGGKLISKNNTETNSVPVPTNVILHLKCSLKDIESDNNVIGDPMNYNASVPPVIKAYDHTTENQFYELNSKTDLHETNAYKENVNIVENKITEVKEVLQQEDVNMKDINQKLKQLKVNLYKNQMDEKKSACFWCTYEFDNQTCYIPRYENNGDICGYGSFCRPECAVAYLMKENIDDSTKFERYHLLNSVYSKIYEYKNNIKPAPNPHYLLDKFYGNLNIQEYRKLLNSERMLMIIDSPLTRILPELHEDTDDFTAGIYGGNKGSATQAGGVYKVKRQSEKTQSVSKADIMKERFGMAN